jgi:uncharacterized membrane-anchored protein YhcB (DUF1043 family)
MEYLDIVSIALSIIALLISLVGIILGFIHHRMLRMLLKTVQQMPKKRYTYSL